MITDKQEQMMSEARGKARQSKQTPLLINRENLRLMPNTPLIRKRPNYMPYDGKADDSEPVRRAYVEGRANHRPRVVNSAAEADAFDIGKCTKDELVTFAMGEYGVMLDAAKDVRTLRREFMAQVEALDAATSTEAMN